MRSHGVGSSHFLVTGHGLQQSLSVEWSRGRRRLLRIPRKFRATFSNPPTTNLRTVGRTHPSRSGPGGRQMATDADAECAFQAFFESHHADLARLAYLITGDPNA